MPKSMEERVAAYKICQERGHTSSGVQKFSMPPLNVCAHCDTEYRYEQVLHESNAPVLEDASGSPAESSSVGDEASTPTSG